jgi:hypothetical protein
MSAQRQGEMPKALKMSAARHSLSMLPLCTWLAVDTSGICTYPIVAACRCQFKEFSDDLVL